MTHDEILLNYNQICRLLENRQIKEMLEKAESLVYNLMVWQLLEKTKELKETYHWMLKYAVEGVEDPQQKKVYNSLLWNCYKLIEEVKEELLSINSHNYVYSQKRFFPHTRKIYMHGLVSELELAESNAQLPELLEQSLNAKGKEKEYALQHEELSSQLFKQCWLAAQYTDDDFQLFKAIIKSQQVSASDKCLAISALTLSLLRFFDEDRLTLLLEQCTNENEAIAQRALVGLLPILAKYDSRLPLFPHLRNRLVILVDNSKVSEHIKRIMLQYARTNETEKITKKLQEEILPEMMKVAPKIREKIDIENLGKNEDRDEKNPEWQEMLEESGIADKLKEFSELQMEGSDVYMSTFAMLKNFAFFHEISNWFRPFNAKHSEILELFEGEENTFLSAMMNNSYMCNSDRFSFCLSLLQMPENQRKMMSKAFTAEAEQMQDIQKEENILLKGKQAEFISNAYIQDLYRFYKLFSYKDDFENPFVYSLRFHHTWFFSLIGYENEDIRQIAEYYFSKNFFPQALELFKQLEAEDDKTADLFQKMGYCHQQMEECDKALKYYMQADIISPNNKWTIRKIALCYRMVKDYEHALEYYLKSEEFYPNRQNIQIQIGNCFLHLKKYEEALSYYFKVEYDSTDNIKMWRAIAWTSFLCGKLEQAAKFYNRIIEKQAQWTDFLNAGHVEWTNSDKKSAAIFYKKALELSGNDIDIFIKAFNEDSHYLKEKGIDPTDISIILDYFRSVAQEQ